MSRLILVLVLTASLLTSGCGLFGQNQAPPEPKTPPKADQKEEPKKETKEYYVGLKAPVEGIEEWVNRYKVYEGVFLQKKGKYRLLLISMGEKFVPGYSLKLEEVKKEQDKWVVRVSFKEEAAPPDADPDTYIPWEVLTLPDDGKPVEVVEVTKNGSKPLEVIEIPENKQLPASKSFIIIQPLAGEKVENPVKIQGKARVFEANFRIIIKEGTNELATKVVMADEGAPGWGEFQLELPFKKPVSPDIVIVFAYENMENGEMIQELTVPVKVDSK